MNKIKIMEASVKKWERIIAGKAADGGVIDCPPCRIFYVLICIGCPIAEYTGKKFCKDSAYIPWFRHQVEEHGKMRRKIYCEQCTKLAEDMRDFMQEIVDHLKEQKRLEEKQNDRDT